MTTHVQLSTRASKQACLVGIAILSLAGLCFSQAAISLSPVSGSPIAVTGFGTATGSVAPQEKVLHSFGNGTDGAQPLANLIFDAAANLYSTAQLGGAYGNGTVFELTPRAGGGWTEKVLHTFGSGTDGALPDGGLIFDAAGNLYGTTTLGGANSVGIVFELRPRAGGGWTEKVLHTFGSGTDGANPTPGVIFDAAGNLYGTTQLGGANNAGTVFELRPRAGGGWTEKVLHSFDGTDGSQPVAGLIFDAAGNLYGTTQLGGAYGGGTVFALTKAGGGWTESVLHSFGNGTDGTEPHGSLIFDAAGNLYGTTYWGGTGVYGTVFELMPRAGGGWTEKILHNFPNNDGTDGSNPNWGSLVFDAAGSLYGTTSYGGGASSGAGTVFKLHPIAGGSWAYTVLHNFNGTGTDGSNLSSGLVFDAVGNLYGTTWAGGAYGLGTVFEIRP